MSQKLQEIIDSMPPSPLPSFPGYVPNVLPTPNEPKAPTLADKYPHYYKLCPYTHIDVYRVLELFNVTDPCIAHAIKKMLVAGGRGGKDTKKDVQEAIVCLDRWLDMRREEV